MLSFNYKYKLKRFEFQALVGGVGIKFDGNTLFYLNADLSARYLLAQKNGWKTMLSAGLKYLPFYISAFPEDMYYENRMQMLGPFVGLRFKKEL
jgi:hypothetical protein